MTVKLAAVATDDQVHVTVGVDEKVGNENVIVTLAVGRAVI
jgi:hypothetical protein